jgi:hypothetical protein
VKKNRTPRRRRSLLRCLPTPASRRRRALAVAFFLLLIAPAPSSAATEPPPVSSGATAVRAPSGAAVFARPVEVRFGLSRTAAEELSEVRVRRLLDIELPDGAALASAPVGPLGDRTAYVWIDRPTSSRLEIQVKLDGRAVVRRQIAVSGLTSDVAARLVAIATSEMIRAEMQKARAPRRPPVPRRPSPEEIELASRDLDAVTFTAGPYASVISGDARALAGTGVGLGLRRRRATESIFARWLASPRDDDALRWFEAGISGDYRFWLGASWRLSLGGVASVASLHLPGASSVDGIEGENDSWSARAGAGLGLEAKLGGPVWLGLTLEPGVVLRPASYADALGAPRAVEGAWLGLGLSLAIERR